MAWQMISSTRSGVTFQRYLQLIFKRYVWVWITNAAQGLISTLSTTHFREGWLGIWSVSVLGSRSNSIYTISYTGRCGILFVIRYLHIYRWFCKGYMKFFFQVPYQIYLQTIFDTFVKVRTNWSHVSFVFASRLLRKGLLNIVAYSL